MIRVFLADDHAVVRRGLEALISTEEDMEVVGTAADGIEAVDRVAIYQPDVVLLDLQMPRKSGLEAIGDIRVRSPKSRIMMLTSFGEKDMVFEAIKAGALGYLLKDCRPEELIQAIRNTHAGKATLSPDVALKVIEEINKPAQPNVPLTEEPLTEREVEILKYVARGMSNQEIADLLVLSERTVRTHISNIFSKLHLANRTQATLYALREGIANLDEEEQ
jgi:two-component system, NarL family, response regulator LiaR